MTKELNIGIVGLGTVGSGVIKSIEKNRDYFKNNYDVVFNILGISANSKSKERSFNVSNYKWFDNPLDIINEKNIDTVIELIGGEDGLAYDLAINSLKNNKNFITANKALISKHGEELSILTEEYKNFFGFEASVAGGIPIIKTLKESIILNEVKEIYAILNGTSNYILSNMSKLKISFDEALKDAQDKGYAESDPTLDINGEDSAHKLSILNSIIFSEIPSFKSIHIKGIENIDLIDHHHSSEFGYNIRLIALSVIADNGVYKEVTPMLVDKDSSLGRVDEANNIIKIIGQESGDVVLEGQGAGEGPCAAGRLGFRLGLGDLQTDQEGVHHPDSPGSQGARGEDRPDGGHPPGGQASLRLEPQARDDGGGHVHEVHQIPQGPEGLGLRGQEERDPDLVPHLGSCHGLRAGPARIGLPQHEQGHGHEHEHRHAHGQLYEH